MASRPKIPQAAETELLTKSRRKCCLCYYLRGDEEPQAGQIAHCDHDRENNAVDNLAWLCFVHHNEYDSRTSQAKGITIHELKAHRNALYETIILQDAARAAGTASPESVDQVVRRYEELLELREESIRHLREEKDRQAVALETANAALSEAEREMAEARKQVADAKHSRDAAPIAHTMKVEGAIRRILYLEPYGETRRLMTHILQRFGYVVKPVATSAEALSEVREESYDLFLGEIEDTLNAPDCIPGESAFRVMEEAKGKGIPAVALTVLDEKHEIARSLHRGFVAHLCKPTSLQEVFGTIRNLAAKRTGRESTPAMPR